MAMLNPLVNERQRVLSVVLTHRAENDPLPSVPFIKPDPPQLSQHLDRLLDLEASGVFSNFGPVNTALEQNMIEQVFGTGRCVTVCNATSGLILAMREVLDQAGTGDRRYALMPSFTFAAAAHAALWCGLTPLLCDIDPETWLPSAESEEELLRKYRGEIAVVMPAATFGNNLDLARYARMAEAHSVPIVVDAAGSLGSLGSDGRGFGSGFRWPVVFSMHATKPFSVGEGGLIYSADTTQVERMRSMASFGFQGSRTATLPGMNAKMSELTALIAQLQLERLPEVVARNQEISQLYSTSLPSDLGRQRREGMRQIKAFFGTVLPERHASRRALIMDQLKARGIGTATYFSPHLAEHPYFEGRVVSGALPHSNEIAARALSLPLRAAMTQAEAVRVVEAVHEVV